MLTTLVLAAFLVAHALIHVACISPSPPATADGPSWPFATERSWIVRTLGVPAEVARLLAVVLVAVTLAGYVAAMLVAVGALPVDLWAPAIAVGSVGSLGLLLAFFHPWLLAGIAIDAVLLWATFVAGWTPVSAGLPG